MKYVLGVDGGGTKSDFYIFTTDGKLISRASGGATNHEAYEGGFDEMTPVFESILSEALAGAGISVSQLSAAVCGMAGIDVLSQKTRMEDYLDRLGIACHRVYNDSFLGIKAACPKGYGVSFVNGTGNSVGGIDRNGHWLQVGGTGEAFGDLNGAGGMSRAVICAVYSEFYRCGEKTSMSQKLFRLLGITDPADMTEAVYALFFTDKLTDKDIHNEVLYASAAENDSVALALLRSFGERFAHSIAGCINNLDFGDEVDIALIGSASLKARHPLMLETCRTEAERLTGKRLSLIPLSVPPAVGAVLWAIETATDLAHAESLRDTIAAQI